MIDRQVQELFYKATGTPPFEEPLPLNVENSIGSFHLSHDILSVRLAGSHTSVESARKVVEPFLNAWELEAEIIDGFPVIEFEFLGANELGNTRFNLFKLRKLMAVTADDKKIAAEDTLVIRRTKYPDPPTIRITPEMVNIWSRFKNARLDIRETFQSCAYYCLTVIERSAGGRRSAAKQYHIDVSVLSKLGELTSVRGDPESARKALANHAAPLTRLERKWIDHTIRKIIYQLGLVAASVHPPNLSLSDLPDLS